MSWVEGQRLPEVSQEGSSGDLAGELPLAGVLIGEVGWKAKVGSEVTAGRPGGDVLGRLHMGSSALVENRAARR